MAEDKALQSDRPARSANRPARPRLDDVASRAGVSTATASLVLSDRRGPSRSTRERVMSAAAELGYRADRSASLLARRRTFLLGVTMSLTNPYHAELVEDIHLAASERGYDVVVSPLTGVTDEWHTALRLVDQRCEALVLLGPALTRRQLESVAQHTPIVVVGRRVSARGVAGPPRRSPRPRTTRASRRRWSTLSSSGTGGSPSSTDHPDRSARCGERASAGPCGS